ncbi:acyl carrier protein [Geomonas paludis]|uniref:Acyl carrier protein n=1 Tax=Geomonas paludis TaxID=2740185 RepID=A0A6V8N0X1_9BACT|nr:acyl carrier protein [Geomonas paludis]UPU36867.1 acyl carrier protein [Geomonas paludis]GFO65537.1 acyl carrier protein [Geomonas paludis]
MELQERLNEVFCQVFDDEDIRIAPQMTADDIDGWDSLSHVNLIVAVETTFGIRFTHKEVLTFKNIGDLLNCIAAKVQ